MPNLITHICGTNQTGVNERGMREMQARAYDARNAQYLLIKAPPASGKSRALMYIGLDKIANQGLKKVIVAVPERSIGSSFKTTPLRASGFFADWEVRPQNNLTLAGGMTKNEAVRDFLTSNAKTLVCTHATLRNAYENFGAEAFADCVVAIDEFHHTSADAESKLGELVRGLIGDGKTHIVAMTGSYFRGDTIPVLRDEDERRFTRVTYTYYEQLASYRYLKTLGIGYHFYSGTYLDAIEEVLDLSKKTIVHIPNVNSNERPRGKDKYAQVDELLEFMAGGDASKVNRDPATGFYHVTRPDGSLLKVADLVDDSPYRETVLTSLRHLEKREDLDIIIALGMAKEGFDWIWCEHVLTVGYRNSMTEVIQIIGRATRDAEGKTHAQFTNLVAEPLEEQTTVTDAVNNMLKAISVSLIMEQVLAPNFNFKSRVPETPAEEPKSGVPIQVKGLQEPSTDRVRQIIAEQLDELKIDIIQDPLIRLVTVQPDVFTPAEINTQIIPRVIARRYPDLNDAEVNEIRHQVLLDLNFKNAISLLPADAIGEGNGELEVKREGENVLVKLAGKFINLASLSIDLIDSINPFEHAYEILSKNLDERILKTIHGSIVSARIPMSDEEAAMLWPAIKAFKQNRGREPNLNAQDPREQRLAQAHQVILAAKRKRDAAASSAAS
uniref:Putative DNA helicase / endonuclease n=1 Tax=mine drainage metagenome TaxID=410659 RepID=E6Q0T2_9ZZZZ